VRRIGHRPISNFGPTFILKFQISIRNWDTHFGGVYASVYTVGLCVFRIQQLYNAKFRNLWLVDR